MAICGSNLGEIAMLNAKRNMENDCVSGFDKRKLGDDEVETIIQTNSSFSEAFMCQMANIETRWFLRNELDVV